MFLSTSAQLSPAQLGPAQLGPAQLGPAQLGPAQLGPALLLFCVSPLLPRAWSPWRSLQHTARVYNEGWARGRTIYIREHTVYREELFEPPGTAHY